MKIFPAESPRRKREHGVWRECGKETCEDFSFVFGSFMDNGNPLSIVDYNIIRYLKVANLRGYRYYCTGVRPTR